MLKKLLYCLLLMSVSIPYALQTRDFILEFKGAGFFPTDDCFKAIYGKSGALFGPEFTFQLCDNSCWYGFASIDFFKQCGKSIGLENPTEVRMVPLAVGLKYLFPFFCGDFYLGLGFQPVRVKTINNSDFVASCTSQWGFGGIAKFGTYIDLRCNWVLDLFVDYSFVKLDCFCNYCPNTTSTVVPIKADVSGAIVGVGLGYRF
jgi:outer membrane protein W